MIVSNTLTVIFFFNKSDVVATAARVPLFKYPTRKSDEPHGTGGKFQEGGQGFQLLKLRSYIKSLSYEWLRG